MDEQPMEGFDPDEWNSLVRHYREDLIGQMESSQMVVSIVTPNSPDLKQVIETGLAVLLDKPIVLVVADGAEPNRNMTRLAQGVVNGADLETQEGRDQLSAAFRRLGIIKD